MSIDCLIDHFACLTSIKKTMIHGFDQNAAESDHAKVMFLGKTPQQAIVGYQPVRLVFYGPCQRRLVAAA